MADLPGMSWVDEWDRKDLREARDILTEVKRDLALGHTKAEVSRYPKRTDDINWGPDYFEPRARARMEIAQALMRQKVIKSVQEIAERSGPYADGPSEGLLIIGDKDVVKAALERIELKLNPPKSANPATAPAWESLPKNMRDALPTPSSEPKLVPTPSPGTATVVTKSEQPINEFHRSYGATLGVGLAWVTIVVAVLVVIFLATLLIPGFGDWLITVLEAVSKKS